MRTLFLTLITCLFVLPAYAKYSGGTGEPNDPYQIATAEDLMLLGDSPEDYDKHFVLTADIDLDPDLPGRKVFDKAVIGSFAGVFDGIGHVISNLTITGRYYLGLFSTLASGAEVRSLGVVDVNITGSGMYVGGLVGASFGGIVMTCYSAGTVTGREKVGGLVGYNQDGTVTTNYSMGTVSGTNGVGGLVGVNWGGIITTCYSTGTITGTGEHVGGLVGRNEHGSVAQCYSTGRVSGKESVGGLVGWNEGDVTHCYSTGTVTGWEEVGGLVGTNSYGAVSCSLWDVQTSGQATSAAGTGLTTTEMQDIKSFLKAGWDFVDEIANGTCDYWQISPGDYPRLRYYAGDSPAMPEGWGTAAQPYLIRDARDLGTAWFEPMAHYRLEASLDLSGMAWSTSVITWLGGAFDGNGHIISHLTIEGGSYLGLFGKLEYGAEVRDLGVVDVNIVGSGSCIGGLVGSNGGTVAQCYSTGTVKGDDYIGGLVGHNYGRINTSYCTTTVSGRSSVGGLVGTNAYSSEVGWRGQINASYSTGPVSGGSDVGGLVGSGAPYEIQNSVWDVESSGLSRSAGGVGLTSAEMMDPCMLGLNGFANDPKWILDAGRDYPRLAWEGTPGQIIPGPTIDWLEGDGTAEAPYQIDTADQLIMLCRASALWEKQLVLSADIDLDPSLLSRQYFGQALIQGFTGFFDGNGHTISHLTIEGDSYLGLFAHLGTGAEVKDLGVVDVNITGSGSYVGGLVGWNEGTVTRCYSTGRVSGKGSVGGLAGENYHSGYVAQCLSTGTVSGQWVVGGLVGDSWGSVIQCYSRAAIQGDSAVGGLVGDNDQSVTQCYSTGAVSGTVVGGLIGDTWSGWGVGATGCFWDTETSGQTTSHGGTGKTTAEMQTAYTFLQAGWYICGEPAAWTIDEGNDYPRLWWENAPGQAIEPIRPFDVLAGAGTENDPYLIYTAEEFQMIGLMTCDWDKHFKLMADIDLSGFDSKEGRPTFNIIATGYANAFSGIFDGNGHTISHLTLNGGGYLGLFGCLFGEVRNLGVVDVNITGSGGSHVGGLVGSSRGTVTQCYSSGAVIADRWVGGLVGENWYGTVADCYSTSTVTGDLYVGGLVGSNLGTVNDCYSTGAVSGRSGVGGLVGSNGGTVTQCYSSGAVSGTGGVLRVAGLVGYNYSGEVTHCYSTGAVSIAIPVGGLVGIGSSGAVTGCFWDTQTSGQTLSYGGSGKTTAEMQTASTFLDAGWDFVGETANGTEDIWWILEGKDYPHLSWESHDN